MLEARKDSGGPSVCAVTVLKADDTGQKVRGPAEGVGRRLGVEGGSGQTGKGVGLVNIHTGGGGGGQGTGPTVERVHVLGDVGRETCAGRRAQGGEDTHATFGAVLPEVVGRGASALRGGGWGRWGGVVDGLGVSQG